VQLFGSAQVNAFCMPGGKIAFYWGILSKLQLSDDEVAMIMGHEVAHALREHARERMGKQAATRLGANVVSSLLGLGQLGDLAVGMGAQLLTLKFSRDDETEADLVGLELAARAGYNPEAGVTLWQKMLQANKGAPPEFMSTHPAGDSRIQDIQKVLPKVQPLYARSAKPERDEHRVVTHGPKPLGDAVDQGVMVAAGEIGAADAAGEQHVTHEAALRFLGEEHHVPRRVAWAMPHLHRAVADGDGVAIG
jgi:predicted Zn-dependent protease